MIKKIITDETLPNDLKSDGEILFGSDLGYLISVLKTAVNWNRDDLIRIITGDTDISVAYQDYSTGKTDAQILAEEAGSSGSKLIFFKQDSELEDGFVALYVHNGTSWVKQYEVDFIKLKEDIEQAISDFESGARAFTGFSIDDGSGNVATLVYTHTNGNHYQVLDILYPDGRRAQINEEIYVNYRNATGTLLNSGYVLMGDGTTQGTQAPNGFLFNELSPNAYNILGVTTIDAVTSGSKSKATKLGIVTSIDVSDLYTTGTAYAEGQIVWARGGKLSNVAPAKPGLQVRMGLVINVLGNKVDVMVCPQIFQKLTDSSDVVITNIQSGHTLRYDGTKFINIMDNASNTPYSNTLSLLSSTNVQAAIDELQANKVGKTTTIAGVNLQDSITQSELKVALDIDDLEANKVDKTTTIAGVNLADNITPAELKVALDVDDLESNKVDKTTTIIGIDLADNITLSEFKIALGEATTALSGLMSPTDKARLNALHAVFGESADADAVVNTINEILAVFANYPEGQEVIAALNSKVDKVTGKSLVANTEITKLIALDDMTTLQGKIDAKANAVDVYTKLETYTRNEIDTKDSLKANASDVYTKAETYTTAQVDTIIEDIAPSKGIQSTLLTPSELQNGGTITTSLLTQNLNFIVLVVTNQDTGEVDSDVVSASSIVVGKKFVFFDNENVYFTIGATNSTFTENGNYSLKINALITSDAVQASDIVYDHFLSGLVATNVQDAIDETDGRIDTHIGNTSNPHSVTKTQVGLGNVDNTSDLDKPISTATQTALNSKSDTTHLHDDRYYTESEVDTKLATKSDTTHLHDDRYYTESEIDTKLGTKSDTTHVHTFAEITTKPNTIAGYGITDAYTKTETNTQISTAVSNLVDTAPTTLDTLNELAAALGDNPNFATDVATSIGTKVTANTAITGATKTKITYDSKGLVTSGADAGIADITGLQTALDGKAASSHTHGSITNDGKIGTTANLIVQTGTGGALTAKAAGTTSQFLRGDGSWATPPDNDTIYTHPSGGANTTITAANGKVLSSITVDSLGHTTAVGSKTLAAADIPNLDTSKLTTGTLGVARGGTGATTFTAGNVLVGNGTSAVTTLSRSGIDSRTSFPPSAHSTDLLTSGTLGVARGGTGRTDGYAAGVVETRASVLTKIWTGTQAQYDAIGTKDANTLYFIM